MAADWNVLIAIGIVIVMILIIAAKVTGQTIMELLGDIRDFFGEKKEDTVEMATQVYD